MSKYDESLGTPFKYEYRCISQENTTIAEGEFILKLACTIKSPRIQTSGIFALMDIEHGRLRHYKGNNHLRKVEMKVTNMFTKSTRYFD